jgi:signal transduction histidine kinase
LPPRSLEDDLTALLFASAPHGLALVDGQGVILDINAALRRLLGDEAVIEGRLLWDLLPASPGAPALHVTRHPLADGRILVTVAVEPPSRLALLGEMAAGLAHEVNQPLNVIGLVAESALDQLEDSPQDPLKRSFAIILEQAGLLRRMVGDLRQCGRPQSAPPRAFDPVAVARAAVKRMAAPLAEAGITVTLSLPRQGPLVLGQPDRFEQVVVNLLTNARDSLARADDGRVVIAFKAGVLSLSDNGPGIAAALRERVFEPFYTTKCGEPGAGLGLSMCRDAVLAMGGRIAVADSAQGTRIEVTLPPMAPAQPATSAAHVLLVDDEPVALRVVSAFLIRHGFRVSTARGGRQAVQALLDDPADAVITDLGMSDGDGRELIQALRRSSPALPIIVVSGSLPDQGDAVAGMVTHLLEKPVPLQALLAHLRAAVGA